MFEITRLKSVMELLRSAEPNQYDLSKKWLLFSTKNKLVTSYVCMYGEPFRQIFRHNQDKSHRQHFLRERVHLITTSSVSKATKKPSPLKHDTREYVVNLHRLIKTTFLLNIYQVYAICSSCSRTAASIVLVCRTRDIGSKEKFYQSCGNR